MSDSFDDVREALEHEMAEGGHKPSQLPENSRESSLSTENQIQEHLEDLGYM
jgi:hypothetical protein